MKKLLLLHALILLFIYAEAQQEKYSRIKIDISSCDMKIIANAGLSQDDGLYVKGNFLFAELSSQQLSALENEGIQYEIIIDDLSAYYLKRINDNKEISEQKKSQNCFDATDYIIQSNQAT